MPMHKKLLFFIILPCIMIQLFFTAPSISQETGTPKEEEPEDISKFMEDGMQEIDFYSLEELLDVEVDVASLFIEDELVVGSTVSSITARKWNQLGARRTHEALNNEMGVHTSPNIAGMYNIAVRGYTNSESYVGIATLIDGIPVNLFTLSSAFGAIPNFELGILDRIEMIKGPGSAIYGADAFHGVLSLKTFESDRDHYSAGVSGAYPLYYDGNLKLSQGFGGNLIRINAAASASHQGNQDIDYEYDVDDNTTATGVYENRYDSRAGVLKVDIEPLDKLTVRLGAYITYFECEKYPGTHKTEFEELLDKDHSANDAGYKIGTGTIEYRLPASVTVEAKGFYSRARMDYILMVTPETKVDQLGTIDQLGATVTVKQPDNPINLQWLAAYSYLQGEMIENSAVLITPTADIPQDVRAEGFDRKINSVFSQLKWGALKDTLFLLLGGRIDNYRAYGNQYSPRGGVIFLPTKDSSIKALYGRAFKAPNQVQIFGFPGITVGNPNLEPETIDVYELNYIYKGQTWKLNLAGYYSLWKNAIISERAPSGPGSKYYNKGENEAMGSEMNLYYSIDPVAVELGFAYAVSRALDANDPFSDEIRDIEYSAYPEYSINAGLYYTFKPLEINFYLNNRIYLNMKEAPSDVKDDPEYLPVYFRADFNISKIISNKLEIYLDIRNITNRENYLPSVYGAEYGVPEQGTSVMLRAGYKL